MFVRVTNGRASQMMTQSYKYGLFTIVLLLLATIATAKQTQRDQTTQQVCSILNQASAQYAQGKVEQSYATAIDAYYKVYDPVLEPAVRANLGMKRVFMVEQAFNDLSTTLVSHPTAADIAAAKAKFSALCQQVTADTALLQQEAMTTEVKTPVSVAPNDVRQQQSYVIAKNAILRRGQHLVDNYQPDQPLDLMRGFNQLYLQQYEASGMENAMAALAPQDNLHTESLFRQMMGQASAHAPAAALQQSWLALQQQMAKNMTRLKQQQAGGFWSAFISAFLILLREGFEAMLVVTALLAYLARIDQQDKNKTIYYGVGVAVIFSIITAYLLSTILKAFAINREILEGVTMLAAAAVLTYVSYWLFAKRESLRWQQYIQQRMGSALSRGSLFALGLSAFLAVYREGAEIILFYQALMVNSQDQNTALSLGCITAAVALVGVYYLLQRTAFKMPYKLFFSATAVFLFYMAFRFVGGSIIEFQEAGLLSITPTTLVPQMSWLGIYPSIEGVVAQLIFLVPALLGYLSWKIFSRSVFIKKATSHAVSQ